MIKRPCQNLNSIDENFWSVDLCPSRKKHMNRFNCGHKKNRGNRSNDLVMNSIEDLGLTVALYDEDGNEIKMPESSVLATGLDSFAFVPIEENKSVTKCHTVQNNQECDQSTVSNNQGKNEFCKIFRY
jgi:hypothetical protein